MLYRTIPKNCLIVIFCTVLLAGAGACDRTVGDSGRRPNLDAGDSPFEKAVATGRIENSEINESSGIAASRCQEDLLWTHNDSGDGPYIFALDGRGKHRGTWKVEGADNIDWEDIATYKDAGGKCFLIIGDIGNSRKESRKQLTIYRVAEPTVSDADRQSTRKSPGLTEAAAELKYVYPDGVHDAETLMVNPEATDIYVVTKIKNDAAGVYRIKPEFAAGLSKADRVSDLTVPAVPNGFVTGGEIAPDGKRVIICDYFAAYEFSLPPRAAGFDDVWKQKPAVVDLGDRQQGEAISYSPDGNAVFATSEGVNQPLLRAVPRQ